MAMIDGTRDAKENCRDLFLCAQREGRIAEDLPFVARRERTDPASTTIRVVAVDRAGRPIPGTAVDGVWTVTDSTYLAPVNV